MCFDSDEKLKQNMILITFYNLFIGARAPLRAKDPSGLHVLADWKAGLQLTPRHLLS